MPRRGILLCALTFAVGLLVHSIHSAPATAPVAAPATAPTAKPAPPATRPATKPVATPTGPATVAEAVAMLIAESHDRYRDNADKHITIVRPHAAFARLGPNHARQALAAMKGKLTGEPLKDVYIRYHLMDLVNRAALTTPEPFTKDLIDLAPNVPQDLVIELRPWHVYDPPEIGKRYRQLIDSCAVSIGFPPFRRRVDAPESFQYMDPQTRTKAEAMYAEALSLRGKFRETESVANHIYNYRQIWTNWLIRQYRGELLYNMVAQGDAAALDRITDAVAAAAATDPIRATDLVSFLNATYFNGLLGKFDDATLKKVAQKLRHAAAANERAAMEAARKSQQVKGPKIAGPTMSVGWINGGGRWRQVPESLFTIVFGIENGRVPKPMLSEQMTRPGSQEPVARGKPSTQPIEPDAITLEMIDKAIENGMNALEKLRPPDVDLNYCSYVALRLPANYWYSDFTLPGQGALTTCAMIACGESFQNPWTRRRIDWALCFDSPNTYDRAMRLLMLGQVRNPKVEPWIKRDAAWLMDTMTEQGNWEQRNIGTRSSDFGDNANGQYAVLGLFAAQQSGVAEIPLNVWGKVDQYWRQAQRPPGAPGEGGYSVTSSASLKKGANLNAFANRVSSPMTAGGALSLYLSEMYLYGPKRVEVGQSLSPELLRALQYLDDNFSLGATDGDQDFYYYMWTIQNVGGATGFRTFNGIDWFREVTAKLLSSQRPDGLWTGPKGAHVSTSFALLYLARARGPLAVCKLRFDPVVYTPAKVPAKPPAKPAATEVKKKQTLSPRDLAKANAWNNRPNDLFNFATDVSKMLEVPTNWQIADLEQPVYELIETPVLYMATDKAFKLPPEQVQRLRDYLDAGGTLVCVPEGRSLAAATTSMKALAAEVCPGVEPVKRFDNKHAYYTLVGKVKTMIPTTVYETGVRPRVVIIEKDIGRDLQANNPKERDAFSLLMNVYMYAAGKEAARPRIVTNFLTPRPVTPKMKLTAARVKTAGDFDPEPLTMPQLKLFMANYHEVDLDVTTVSPEELSASTQVAFLTVSANSAITQPQAEALRKYAQTGGTLWIDAAGGSPQALAKLEELTALMGLAAELRPLDAEHGVLSGRGLYRGYEVAGGALRSFRHDNRKPSVRAAIIENRAAVLVASGDVTSGIAGMNHWGIAGWSPTASRHLAANTLLQFVPLPPPPATKPVRISKPPTTGPATGPATTQPAIAKAPATQPIAAKPARPPKPPESNELMFPAATQPVTPTVVPATQPAAPG